MISISNLCVTLEHYLLLQLEEIGRGILEYRKAIRQDLPFRLKRLHVWNVSGWTLATRAGDAKMRLVKRLLRTGPVLLQETRWHADNPSGLAP